MKLICIGAGNMGSAILKSLLVLEPPLFDIVEIVENSKEKCEPLEALGAHCIGTESVEIDQDTFVLLAVKPQDSTSVLEALRPKFKPGSVLMSIAAGLSIKTLQEQSGHDAVVRVMPNTPAMIGMGASGWMASSTVATERKGFVRNILESFGVAVEVENEDQIDAVTALSGSGPAYVFYLMEALVEGAQKLGLSPENAQQLAIQTVLGAGHLAQKQTRTLEDLKQLRANVTSKGGTTERALGVMDGASLKSIIEEAMQAAYDRAKELG